jgi:hypothetical protein
MASELINHLDLSYLDPINVRAEIDYLAGKNFLLGGSRNGLSPFSQVQITSDGIEIVRSIMKNYPIYLKNNEDEVCKQLRRQVSAIQSDRGRRLEIYGFIKRKVNYFEDFLDQTNAISLSPIPFNTDKTQIPNVHYTFMGDVFQNIQNSNIVSKSSIENAFNKLEPSDKETRDAFVKVAEFINKSGDPAAGALFTNFADELNKSTPEKSRLKSLWSAIEKVLPAVASVAGDMAKITPLFI